MQHNVKSAYVIVYRYPNGDGTNNGISSKHNIIQCLDGDIENVKKCIEENHLDVDECLYVVRRILFGKPQPYLVPLAWELNKPDGVVCFGGNYAVGDSRWEEWFGHNLPLPIHDRFETWKQYDELSK